MTTSPEAGNLDAHHRLPGVAIAGMTAVVSGVSVFVNSYGVRALSQPAVYTTGKNLVAALVLLVVGAVVAVRRRRRAPLPAPVPGTSPVGDLAPGRPPRSTPRDRSPVGRWLGLAYVGVVGGGVAFVLFFTGLARISAEPAAFLHDTLVIWVGILALPLLAERLSGWNVAAIVLLVIGQVTVAGGIGHLVVNEGGLLVLAATVLWAVETIVVKRLLAGTGPTDMAAIRMTVGVVVLGLYVTATGHLSELVGLDRSQLWWITVTGLLLAAYVATWMFALARARAVDVTSVLVASVVVTSLLDLGVGHPVASDEVLGLVLVAAGTVAALAAWPRRSLVS